MRGPMFSVVVSLFSLLFVWCHPLSAQTSIDLSQLDGTNGLIVNGISNSFAGYAVNSAGDVNHDGYADVIIGAFGVGQAYVVFGNSDLSTPINISNLNGENGFQLLGVSASTLTGNAVSGVGDVNGDGIDDVLVGAPYAGVGGKVYVVFGNSTFNSPIQLDNLDGNNGFIIEGTKNYQAGSAVAGLGDVNGDGYVDILIGASSHAFVVFGNSQFNQTFPLSLLDGSNGFSMKGESVDDQFGDAVGPAGDLNEDGLKDFLVGAPWANGYLGSTYVIFGQPSFDSSLNLASLNGSNGFRIDGVASLGESGNSVDTAGDVNGDGHVDILIGAFFASNNPKRPDNENGNAYVVFGQKDYPPVFNLGELTGVNGFQIYGINEKDQCGTSVAGVGDMNGDGFDDIVIGAPHASPTSLNSGQSYIVFGKSDFPQTFELKNLNGKNGYALDGSGLTAYSGVGVGAAGDFNKDGFADVIIGAPQYDHSTGQSYIVFGGKDLP
eukprot:CAMPEP_0201490322 /NCGR_PEP_ID=MMETSP0151_2-20130828/26205_1 /ASSEMBLY_ACC=CAM_ASM_000257 /TAXON_ID=200890 /ORGANISM="Paramoeba atlantica, Strain 621/1 / CCAP 1560/9" /LENGTH=492 /DNA_ID=CAMNT_0047876249 /DNA_START=62 /DNA_END=1540 /DNA_ORIENTATION=-